MDSLLLNPVNLEENYCGSRRKTPFIMFLVEITPFSICHWVKERQLNFSSESAGLST